MKRIVIALLIASGILLTSCYTEPEKGIAKITIRDSMLALQPGANVHLYGPAGSTINVNGLTNFQGVWEYEHDPALEVILNVHATYTDGSGLHEVHDIIRIRPGETANETYVLN